jgi:hypothetical protein
LSNFWGALQGLGSTIIDLASLQQVFSIPIGFEYTHI